MPRSTRPWLTDEVIAFLNDHPELSNSQAAAKINEALGASITRDQIQKVRKEGLVGVSGTRSTSKASKVRVSGDDAVIDTNIPSADFDPSDLGDADAIVSEFGLDPADWVLVKIDKSEWEAQIKGGGTRDMTALKLSLKRRTAAEIPGDADRVLADLRELAQRELPAPNPLRVRSGGGTTVALLADMHLGKKVEPGVVGPQHTGYNAAICEERFNRHIDEIIEDATRASSSTIVLACGADLFDGSDMRRGHQGRVDLTVGQQFQTGLSMLVGGIARIAAAGFLIRVLVVPGNHTRIGEKGVNPPQDNVELMAGWALQHAFAGRDDIDVTVSTQPTIAFDVDGVKIGLAHGDHCKGATPAAVIHYVRKQQSLLGVNFDVFLMAHYHTTQRYSFGDVVVYQSGCYDGGDEYSIVDLGGLWSVPEQWTLQIENGRVVSERVVRLAEPRQPQSLLKVA